QDGAHGVTATRGLVGSGCGRRGSDPSHPAKRASRGRSQPGGYCAVVCGGPREHANRRGCQRADAVPRGISTGARGGALGRGCREL
ncbi:unnamed protein product, partial [Ectocarpus fasciculatus]